MRGRPEPFELTKLKAFDDLATHERRKNAVRPLMSRTLIYALLALGLILGLYSGYVMKEKFTFNNQNNPDTKTTDINTGI